MKEPLFQKVDCLRIPVPELDDGLAFYHDTLGHELIWGTETMAGSHVKNAAFVVCVTVICTAGYIRPTLNLSSER